MNIHKNKINAYLILNNLQIMNKPQIKKTQINSLKILISLNSKKLVIYKTIIIILSKIKLMKTIKILNKLTLINKICSNNKYIIAIMNKVNKNNKKIKISKTFFQKSIINRQIFNKQIALIKYKIKVVHLLCSN